MSSRAVFKQSNLSSYNFISSIQSKLSIAYKSTHTQSQRQISVARWHTNKRQTNIQRKHNDDNITASTKQTSTKTNATTTKFIPKQTMNVFYC